MVRTTDVRDEVRDNLNAMRDDIDTALAQGDPALINAIRTLALELKADFNLLLAKLDADAGVTDTNYAATLTIAAADPGSAAGAAGTATSEEFTG